MVRGTTQKVGLARCLSLLSKKCSAEQLPSVERFQYFPDYPNYFAYCYKAGTEKEIVVIPTSQGNFEVDRTGPVAS